ncbi:hypothetical protein VE04_06606 [Pseudogymnoascus sp. 24MN13]|nr:hypothetical protein VE04_06606 [Pseudogymnoascus sp. 24MN13]
MPNELPPWANGIGKLETQEGSRYSWTETRSVQMMRITSPPREEPLQYLADHSHPHEHDIAVPSARISDEDTPVSAAKAHA